MKYRRLLIAFIAMISWVATCAAHDDARIKIPFSIPVYHLNQPGMKISADFDTPRHPSFWRFLAPITSLPLGSKQPHLWGMYMSFKSKAKRTDKSTEDISSVPVVPVRLKIKIVSIDDPGKTVAYDKEVRVGKVLAARRGWSIRLVDTIELIPGTYHLEVESVKDVPGLADTTVNFGITHTPGK